MEFLATHAPDTKPHKNRCKTGKTCVSDRFITARKWAKLVQLVHKLVKRSRVEIFFATNAPVQPH
jgi:hypothetical protein